MHGLIGVLNWDENQKKSRDSNLGNGLGQWRRLSTYSSLGILQALRDNGMWVYLSPQINGVCDSAKHLLNCGQYQVVQKNIVFRVHILLMSYAFCYVFSAACGLTLLWQSKRRHL